MRAIRVLALFALGSCAEPRVHAVTLIAPAAPPASRPCVVEATSFTPDSPMRLVTSSGAAFAEVRSADRVMLTIDAHPRLETTVRGVRLVTPARPDLLPLRARTVHVFRGILVPGGGTPLAWAAAQDGAVAIAPERDGRLSWLGARPLDAVACSEVALESSLDAGQWPEGAEPVLLRPGAIPIAAAPGAAPVAELGGAVDVLVTERRGAAARIVWNASAGALEGARIVGWIDASAIASPHAGVTMGRGRTVAGMEATSDWSGCDEDHPLFVEIGGRLERVGDVLAGTRVQNARTAERGLVRVDLVGPEMRADPPEIALLPGASFVMSPGAAEACR